MQHRDDSHNDDGTPSLVSATCCGHISRGLLRHNLRKANSPTNLPPAEAPPPLHTYQIPTDCEQPPATQNMEMPGACVSLTPSGKYNNL